MDKYKKLISNTFIFAIGTFSSKVLVFLLMPLYTRVLTTGDMGIVDLIVPTANLIIPIVSVGISNGIIRFGLDRSVRKSDVFSTGIITVAGGYLLFLLLRPLLLKIPIISEYSLLIYLYVLTSCLRSLCSQFVRAKEYVKLYAFDGVLSTIMVILFNILFLVVFKLGITGYVLATILSDLFSSVFLFTIASLGKYIRFRGLDWQVFGSMLKFCLPLLPTTIFWWITNASDRYLVTFMINEQANGLLGIAYKIPTMIILVSGIFSDAWQMSAITESERPGQESFFSNVFNAYQSMIFIAASGLILFCKLITKIFASPAFYESWQYMPFLIMATTFSCFVTFLGSIYMVEKKSMLTLMTTAAGAVINIVLNFMLIPLWGVNGATFASFISYFVVFCLRALNTRRFIKLHWNVPKVAFNLLILLTQTLVILNLETGWVWIEALLCLLMIAVNFKMLLLNLRRFLSRR